MRSGKANEKNDAKRVGKAKEAISHTGMAKETTEAKETKETKEAKEIKEAISHNSPPLKHKRASCHIDLQL